MTQPFKCPICDGRGKTMDALKPVDCHVCKGKGIVWSPEDNTQYHPPMYPWPYYEVVPMRYWQWPDYPPPPVMCSTIGTGKPTP